jgi:hypothetical protein
MEETPSEVTPNLYIMILYNQQRYTEQFGLAATLWTCIQVVLGLNLDRDTGHPNSGFLTRSWQMPE